MITSFEDFGMKYFPTFYRMRVDCDLLMSEGWVPKKVFVSESVASLLYEEDANIQMLDIKALATYGGPVVEMIVDPYLKTGWFYGT